jgi:hypothetical protein
MSLLMAFRYSQCLNSGIYLYFMSFVILSEQRRTLYSYFDHLESGFRPEYIDR